MESIPFPSKIPTSHPNTSNTSSRLPSQDRANNLDSMIDGMSIQQKHNLPAETHIESKEGGIEDKFDYQATVNALTLQFLNENEETRVAALQWLSMLHQKAPKKVNCLNLSPKSEFPDTVEIDPFST